MKNFLKMIFGSFTSAPVHPTGYTGANIDTRPPEAKVDDIHFSEIVATASAVDWIAKTTFREFPALNQNGTFECGAFSARKTLGVMYAQYPKYGQYVDFSSSDIYKQRAGTAGMSFPEVFAAWKNGVTLQALVNDNPKLDADTDNLVIPQWMRGVGAQFAISGGGVYVPNDIDTIASVIQTTGKAVMIITYFTAAEWSQYTPFIINNNLVYNDPNTLRHFVTVVDFALVNGGKALIIEDSAWFGGLNRRIITEDWVKKRVVVAGYPMNFNFMPAVGTRPTYDGSTISLQQCLRYDGEFPTNVSFIESFGPVTRNALTAFQVKHGLSSSAGLDSATVARLRQLFP